MLTYRATLRPRSAWRSPLQADTLFGHCCWLAQYAGGDAALKPLLDPFRNGAPPPLLFSNGFPTDRLPRPLVLDPSHNRQRSKAAQISDMEARKASVGVRWVSVDEFNALRCGKQIVIAKREDVALSRPVLKNQINRITGGTTPVDPDDDEPGGGNLYGVVEEAFVDRSALRPVAVNTVVYVRAQDQAWADLAHELLRELTRTGYGAKKSVGYGQFELIEWIPFDGFAQVPNANGFVSLSNWVPARTDPTRGSYTTLVKYGKLGEELATTENPFKFPLLMLTAGSTFYTDGPPREWYGRLVDKIAPANDDIVQYGYAFAVPIHIR